MFIYCLELQLALPSHSLKEKRGILKSILNRSRNRYNVACAEVDRQDNTSHATLAFVTVSPNKPLARKTLETLENWVYEDWPDVEITAAAISEV